MLDVHALSKKIHGVKDFLLHILTITVGLLIALSLEAYVDAAHHRALVRDAKASMHDEIARNAQQLAGVRKDIVEEQKALDDDLAVLVKLRDDSAHFIGHENLSFTFQSTQIDDAAWRTAQTAGAFTYMPYADVEQFSGIYGQQSDFHKAQQQARDNLLDAASVMVGLPQGTKPTEAETLATIDRVRVASMRLAYLRALTDSLDKSYHMYLDRRTSSA